MLRSLSLLLALFIALGCTVARAASTDICETLSQLERFPYNVAQVRSGHMALTDAQAAIAQAERAFGTPAFKDPLSTQDLGWLKSFTAVIDRQLSGAGNPVSADDVFTTDGATALPRELTSLIARLGCRENPNLEPAPQGVIAGKAKSATPASPQKRPSAAGSGQGADTSLSGVVMLAIAAITGTVLLPAYFWFSHAARKNRIKRGCCVKALLVYGELCTVTYVLQVGKKGAKLQAPSADLPAEGVELFVAGHRIKVKKDWMNQYYLGLTFVSPQSEEVVAEIIAESQELDPLSRLEENPPDCFYTDCYLNCKNHRETQLSLHFSQKKRAPALAD